MTAPPAAPFDSLRSLRASSAAGAALDAGVLTRVSVGSSAAMVTRLLGVLLPDAATVLDQIGECGKMLVSRQSDTSRRTRSAQPCHALSFRLAASGPDCLDTSPAARRRFLMPARKVLPDLEIAALYRSGLSADEIAERFSVSPPTILRRLRAAGVERRAASEAAAVRVRNGRAVLTRYWTGKQRSAESRSKQAETIRGDGNHRWKGGVSDPREYRKVVAKDRCARCGTTRRLGIHHLNDDHYDNAPENLVVLCVSCHSSVHKQAYWDAVKSGQEPPRSNAPIGWGRR